MGNIVGVILLAGLKEPPDIGPATRIKKVTVKPITKPPDGNLPPKIVFSGERMLNNPLANNAPKI